MKLPKLTTDQQNKVIKTALWLGLSASVSAVISAIAQDPNLFGVLTPIVNLVLVAAKQFLTEEK